MTRQTNEPLRDLRLGSATNRSAREIAWLAMDGSMTVNPPYQRDSVWTEDQRIALVRSWIQDVPVPAVVVNLRDHITWTDGDPGDVSYAVVDGKQRIETAVEWFQGRLAVPASWFPAEDVLVTENTEDGPYVRYTGLSRSMSRRIGVGGFKLAMIEGALPTVRAEAELYTLLNGGGTPQTEADMARAARVAGDL